MDIEKYSVMVIAYAGDSKSASMEAVEAARKGDFEEVEKLLKQSEESLMKAHDVHTKLLVENTRDGNKGIPMILVHASNHFSAAELTRDFSRQIIKIYQKIENDHKTLD